MTGYNANNQLKKINKNNRDNIFHLQNLNYMAIVKKDIYEKLHAHMYNYIYCIFFILINTHIPINAHPLI